MRRRFPIKFFLFLALFLTLPFFIKADSVGEKEDFFIEPSYDFRNKESAKGTPIALKRTPK